MTEFRIELFGAFRVGVDGRAVPEEAWRQRKPAALVKLLALAPRHRVHREQVMDALWPDLAPAAAAANLRKALHRARRATAGESDSQLVESIGELLALPDGTWVDVDAFRASADRARRTADTGAYEEALELYGQGLLPDDRYEEWAVGPRDELQLDFLALAEELAALLESRGEIVAAARVVGLQVAVEPLLEEAHVRLMRLYALAGRRGDALRSAGSRARKLNASTRRCGRGSTRSRS